jgi:psiF repeat
MLRSCLAAALLLLFALATGTVRAEDAAPAAAAAKASDVDKKAISKACSDQANAKGLHGKERKKFRSECKHKGGKVE